MPMRYFVDVNPALFKSKRRPMGFVRFWLTSSRMLFPSAAAIASDVGLVRLMSKRYTVKFERRTDLEAIHRGYGEGLNLSHLGLRPCLTRQTSAKATQLFFSGRNHGYPSEIAREA